MPTMFDPLKLGAIDLPNRVIMAPLTRMRAGEVRAANALMAEYYAQRASAGLILSEATSVEPMGVGYPSTPGIWSDEQAQSWKVVTDAVHKKGGRIFMQLWHVGRISDPTYLNGEKPISASAIPPEGHVTLIRPKKSWETPRAMDEADIARVVAAFKRGAENAMRAGFDGVELHGANGYLLDQFLQDGSNKRTDRYGGPIENRARFMLECVDAVVSVWGADRVGLHLAPRGDSHTMGDSNPLATFTHVAKEAKKRGLAFLFAREHVAADSIGPKIREAFGGPFIANERLTPESAARLLAEGKADAVSFGALYIANPDLYERLKLGAPLNEPNVKTYYYPDQTGYTDYPFLDQTAA